MLRRQFRHTFVKLSPTLLAELALQLFKNGRCVLGGDDTPLNKGDLHKVLLGPVLCHDRVELCRPNRVETREEAVHVLHHCIIRL